MMEVILIVMAYGYRQEPMMAREQTLCMSFITVPVVMKEDCYCRMVL